MKGLLGLIVIGAIVFGGYYLSHKAPTTAPVEGSATTTPTTTDESAFNGSFSDLAKRSGSWKCTIDTSTTQSVSSGVAYVSNGKVRGDFTTSVANYGPIESHMIADGDTAYTWSSMMPQGIKMKIATTSTATAGSGATSGQGMNANTSYAYHCEAWTADPTIFIPPTTIVFKAL